MAGHHYLSFQEIQTETAVTHSVKARLCEHDEYNLVLVRGKRIEVYQVLPTEGASPGTVLNLVETFVVSGVIESIQVIEFEQKTKYSRDGLILTFFCAKASIVGYDRHTRELVTLSLHNLEEGSMGPGTSLHAERFHGQNLLSSKNLLTRVDPQGRCAALLTYSFQLVVLPLRHTSNDFSLLQDGEEEAKSTDKVTVPTTRLISASEDRHAEGYETGVVSHPFVLHLDQLGLNRRIFDFGFLHMYLEPTLIVLHETTASCAGRFATNRDATALSVFSLNVTQRLCPKIWSTEDLPYNAFRIVPVPKPIGGVVVLCTNEVLYFNQTQYAGVGLNAAFAERSINSEKYPIAENPTPLNIILDEFSRATFVSPNEMILALENGDLYMLQLALTAQTNQKIILQELDINTMACTCICKFSSDLLFFGSRTGDSLLIQMTKKAAQETSITSVAMSETKRLKVELSQEVEMEVDGEEDDDDMMLYGESTSTSLKTQSQNQSQTNGGVSNATTYEFKMLDSLVGVGPVADCDFGQAYIEDDESTASTKQPRKELVTVGGYGKGSALCVLHRGLRPVVGTEAELKGCRAMWTVKDCDDSMSNQDAITSLDSYLVLSVGSGTMILSTSGDEMDMVDAESSEFYTDGATLAAGNLFNGKRIIQIYRSGARIIHNLKCTQELAAEDAIDTGGLGMGATGLSITLVDIFDPYALLCLSDGTVRLIKGDPEDFEVVAEIPNLDVVRGNGVTAASMFRDTANCFGSSVTTTSAPVVETVVADIVDSDDDDALYGSVSPVKNEAAPMNVEEKPESRKGLMPTAEADIFCVLARESGTVEIYRLPNFVKVAEFPKFAYGPKVLFNQLGQTEGTVALGLQDSVPTGTIGPAPMIADILTHRVGPVESIHNAALIAKCVMVSLLANGDVLLYAAYPVSDVNQVRMEFRRIESSMITRPFTRAAPTHSHDHRKSQNAPATAPQILKNAFRYPMFTRFNNINGRSGVFFRGIRPLWILCDRGLPQLVIMDVINNKTKSTRSKNLVPVLCFTPFSTTNSLNGFIYFHNSGLLRVCQLPSAQDVVVSNFGSETAIRKIPVKHTIHALSYLGKDGPSAIAEALEVPTYAMAVSKRLNWEPEEEEETEGESKEDEGMLMLDGSEPPKEMYEIDFKDKRQAPPIVEERYEIRLIQSNTWDVEGISKVELQRYECVLCLKVMYLSDTAQHSNEQVSRAEWKEKRRPYVVVSTGFVTPEGEDNAGSGRILLFEVDYAQYTDEDGQTGRKQPKLKLVYEKEHKSAAITMLTQMGEYVLAAIGPKIIVHQLKSEQLIGCAFYDAQVYIVSMKTIKDYVLFGDVYKSIHFLRWKEYERSLTLLGKDFNPLPVHAIDFSISDKSLGLIAADDWKNISVFDFSPDDVQSRGGQQLIQRNDMHIGSHITSIVRQRVPNRLISSNKVKQRFVNLLASTEGAIFMLVPVSERVFRRLYTLQSLMINALPQNAGMNPKEFRYFRHGDQNPFRLTKRGILDGQVLLRYATLDLVAQKELARCIGTTPEMVMQNLLESQLASTVI